MFGSPYILLAIVVAFGGALAWGKIESALASHYKALDATNQQVIAGKDASIKERDALVLQSGKETKAANDTIAGLRRSAAAAKARATAADAQADADRAALDKRNADELNAPRVPPEQSCVSACSKLSAPL